jgi:hypothetical protein
MESLADMRVGMVETFLALIAVDIIWKNKYIGSETIRVRFPNEGKQVGNF